MIAVLGGVAFGAVRTLLAGGGETSEIPAFGGIHYVEDYEIRLTSLDPVS